MKPVFSRSWTDAFGTTMIHLEGSTGQQTALLLCALEHGQAALTILEQLPWFKGRITLAVFEHNHSTPVQAVLRFLEPKMVIALDAEGIVSSGDSLNLETQISVGSTGLEYQHGGEFSAWRSSLGIVGTHGLSYFASFSGSSEVLACSPLELQNILESLVLNHR